MFERLAQQVLGNLLSKYFTEESLAENKIYSSAQLGVWSGYISLKNLELKKEVVNSKIQSKGHPFEIVTCTFRQIEITIPWAKLSNPISSQGWSRNEDAVVVAVVDGIHLLARTNFNFDDEALRREEVKKRRETLSDPFTSLDGLESKSYKDMLKQRFKDGLMQEIASKIHVHLRDVHVRLEDVESDPENPSACGITLESMHIQHDDSSEAAGGVVAKMAQLNHLALYWNALGYEDGLPVENSILHQIYQDDTERISRSLNFCISRRASIVASPSKSSYIPTHTFLLLPVDGTWHGRLSVNPKDLSSKPAAEITINIDPVFGQLRNFQCVQINRLVSEYKNHQFVKRYRKFRPLVSVMGNPRAWWHYAARVIRYQVRESFLRWSWARFVDVYQFRRRYMSLYERKLRFPQTEISKPPLSSSISRSLSGLLDSFLDSEEDANGTADAGAGPNVLQPPEERGPLTPEEAKELQDMEDGVSGNMSISTILLFRAMVNVRMGQNWPLRETDMTHRKKTVSDSEFIQDSEARAELEKLLSSLETVNDASSSIDKGDPSLVAIFVEVKFEELSLSLLAPHSATSGESLLRQIHEKIIELSVKDLRFGYVVCGDYEGKEYSATMHDLVATEIRPDRSHHIVVKQADKQTFNDANESLESNYGGDDKTNLLLFFRYAQSAKMKDGSDVVMEARVNALEWTLVPECGWISYMQVLRSQITRVPKVSDYWSSMSLAYINSLALGRMGLLVKRESANSEHKNLQADVMIHCPILRIGDGKGGHLIVDLGVAHLATERLAGKSSSHHLIPNLGHTTDAKGNAGKLPQIRKDDVSTTGSISSRTRHMRGLSSPSVYSRRGHRPAFSSSFSVDSRQPIGHGDRSVAGSLLMEQPLRINVLDEEADDEAKTLNFLFYDVFSFKLQTGKVTFCGESDAFEIAQGFEIHTIIKKSVLPSDHTLCKLKSHTVVETLQVDLNREVVLLASDAGKRWAALLKRPKPSNEIPQNHVFRPLQTRYLKRSDTSSVDDASLSQIDEGEFFDADQPGSFNGDNSANWFEDNWISDAESFIDSDSRSDRRRKKRRAGSISDVSSVSDVSAKESAAKNRKVHQGSGYLSAENLARLEEGAGEDESVADNLIELDDASFHSVMSISEQKNVLCDLDNNIKEVRSAVETLSSKLRGLNLQVGGTNEKLRNERMLIRAELTRAKAELNGLRALHRDFEDLLTEEGETTRLGHGNANGVDVASLRNSQAKTTRALLAARRRRNLMLESNGAHSMTRGLNRDLFQGSVALRNCRVSLHLHEDRLQDGSDALLVFDIVATQTGLAFFHQVEGTKLYFSSDSLSAGLRDSSTSQRSIMLFSGGNPDTYLQSHFPHLVSCSMEEKFLRGSVNLKKREVMTTARTNAGKRAVKARLVIGDVEIFPSKRILSPLLEFCRSNSDHTGDAIRSEAPSTGNEFGEKLPDASCERGKPSIFADLAIRMSSLRVVVGSSRGIFGAAALSEAAIRFINARSLDQDKLQVDVKFNNMQLLQISSHESGLGSEIFGRRDPYHSLLQIRLRSQVVTESNAGGWVIGLDSFNNWDQATQAHACVRNLHAGMKINPLNISASPEALANFRDSIEELKAPFLQNRRFDEENQESEQKPPLLEIVCKYHPVRWRIDLSLKRIAINFPELPKDDWNSNEEIGSRMKMVLTFACCLQESISHRGHIAIQSALTEVVLTRSSDDWPIIEHISILCDATLESKYSAQCPMLAKPRLEVDSTSSVNEIAAILQRFGWDGTTIQHEQSIHVGVITKITPIKVNATAGVVSLVAEIVEGLLQSLKRQNPRRRETNPINQVVNRISSHHRNRRMGLHFVVEQIEVEILQEVESKASLNSKSLILFTATDLRIDFEKREQIMASILIRDSSFFDLSSTRAVQIIGENLGDGERDHPYFVRAKLYIDEDYDGPTTVRLDINWGGIQLLVMPSFFSSILSFAKDIKTSLAKPKTESPSSEKPDILTRFTTINHDVNFLLSAHADAFECILSSKDLVEYVRQSGSYPIGVVTLRWKASLSMSLAMDTLRGVSVPWLTLNLDGNFTDTGDAGLFKDFVSRYLSQSSNLLFGSDEIGQQVQKAFTGRFGLVVFGFQVIRTTISTQVLKRNSKSVSYKCATRMCFIVTPPPIGEQRVTNPIDLEIIYRAAGATMVYFNRHEPQVEISQLISVNAKFIDVLLYISQSSGGFTESFNTTVRPIIDIFKNQDPNRKRKAPKPVKQLVLKNGTNSSLSRVIRSATTLSTIHLEGFQITCVPGGATRLNESPIVKVELRNLASGMAAAPLPMGARNPKSRSSQNLLVVTETMHMMVGGWVACEISGHYHNRRLVAWEPFLEPWTSDIRFGFDAVETIGLSPLQHPGHAQVKSPTSNNAPLEGFGSTSLAEGKSDRLRDLGRLFRAPFQASLSAKETATENMTISHPDFCYLMLASSSRTTILSAMHSKKESTEEMEARLFSRLPRRERVDWLVGFGFPGRENGETYSATCLVSDSRPLNVNITWALLENLSGYIQTLKSGEGFRKVAPHWIRNDTGMTIRFQEVLDQDRIQCGEISRKVSVVNGAEVPLTLKRSLSQTCDPHRAYIFLEIGSFEDTVGRIRNDDFDIQKGALSSSFFFKAAAKVPVDTVGVHRYPLDRNNETRNENGGSISNSRALGWIIVRVALRDGIKIVSVESPFVLKSTADTDLVCEVRDFNGLSLLWRCLIPKADYQKNDRRHQEQLVSVPADIVPFLHGGSYSLTVFALPRSLSVDHEAELTSFVGDKAIQVKAPPPFSPQSIESGLIGKEELVLSTLEAEDEVDGCHDVHLTACSFRIGSLSGVRAGVEVPEQRMLLFRAPLAIRNCLALPIAVQVRVKRQSHGDKAQQNQGFQRMTTHTSNWEDLGVLECGQSVNWSGADSSQKVQLRVRFEGTDGDNSRKFPDWSSAVYIPAERRWPRTNNKLADHQPMVFARMKVYDADDVALNLSVAFEADIKFENTDNMSQNDIRASSMFFSPGSRAISIFVPFWIVDSTNQDLEFFSGSSIAGQLGHEPLVEQENKSPSKAGAFSLGLAELFDNENFLSIPPSRSFEVLMLEGATRLTMRKRLSRQNRSQAGRLTPPWSDPIPLQADRLSQYDITVLAPRLEGDRTPDADDVRNFNRFILRSRVVPAPERFGGHFGTKLIHVVNRYSILNELGRDVEIASELGLGPPITIRGTGVAQPFHFNDTSPMRLRFKEFGWSWSGNFNIRPNRPEVTLRLRHKMKGLSLIVTVELIEKKGATSMLVFRQSGHPPFRLENHTMFPLHFGQASTKMNSEESDADAMLLPYQSADFAWDEPELRRRTLVLKSSDNPNLPQNFVLGRFQLDKIAPGTVLSVESKYFAGEIVAEGPTRVMRITDSSMPSLSLTRHDGLNEFQHRPDRKMKANVALSVKLLHGIGISIVDMKPQELLYARIEDIQIERRLEGDSDFVSISVGNIKLNNQLWVTPYPVLLRIGRRIDLAHPLRRKSRRNDAIAISWKRLLDTKGSYGNVTLLERVELSTEPTFVNVDGQVATLLFRMAREISKIWRGDEQVDCSLSRDEELQKILNLTPTSTEEAETARKGYSPYQQSSDGDLMATAAVASKLRAQPLPFVTVNSNALRSPRANASKKEAIPAVTTKPQHKYYIEKLRISATKVDLSWTGPLPGLVSSLLLRAFTFERLPLRLRPFSSSHAYGNAKDHMQSIKSHYLSVWRIFDLLIGLSYNPTFLFRAVMYTSRETCVSVLDSWAAEGEKIAKCLGQYTNKRKEPPLPIYDGHTKSRAVLPMSRFGYAIISPLLRGIASTFHASASLCSLVSFSLKFGGHGGKNLAARGFLRSRNPRLFAHMDGRDLLVEYTEAENAGKALLSRVRMGMYLGEGYIFHTEGARILKPRPKSPIDVDPSPLIIMVTSERAMLLNGKLDRDFCSVMWESTLASIVHIELIIGNQMSVTDSNDEIVLWYLLDAQAHDGGIDEKLSVGTRTSAVGVDVLHSMSIFVPHGIGSTFATKMSSMDSRLAQDVEGIVMQEKKPKQD